MAIFNLSHFNFENVLKSLQQTPTPSTYSNIKLFGEGNFVMLHGLSIVYTDQQIQDEEFWSTPEWDINTFLLAKFENNLQAGNITSLPEPLTSWILLRKALNDAKFTKIAEFDASIDTYIDRLASSNEQYTYQWLPKSENLIGAPLEAIPVDTDFNKVVLLNPDENEGYAFCYDLSLSETNVEQDIVFNDTRGKYQTTNKGNKEVHTGNIGVLINSDTIDNAEMEQDFQFLKAFEEYLLRDEEKILKFNRGYTYRVKTTNVTLAKKTGSTNKNRTLYKVSFNWREVGKV